MSAQGTASALSLGLIGIVIAVFLSSLLWGNVLTFFVDTAVWQQMAPLTPLSGQRTFERYVIYPVPTQISDLKTEKSSYGVGEFVTFSFRGHPARFSFLKDWEEMETTIPAYGIEAKYQNGIIKAYTKTVPDTQDSMYLVFNLTEAKGYYFRP